MSIEIVNEDILNGAPIVYVQRYVAQQCTYRVFRKPTSPNEAFEVSPGVVVDPKSMYKVGDWLMDEEVGGGLFEVFVSVYVAEDVPPIKSWGERGGATPYANVVFEPARHVYRGEPTREGFEVVETIEAATLDEVILRVVEAIDPLVAADQQS
jgi:hypothetical protein